MIDHLVRQQVQIELLRRAALKHIETKSKFARCLLRLLRASQAAMSCQGVDGDELTAAQADAINLLNVEHNLGLKP